ncbi:MAG: DotI/IcmL/TraM family protein [Candidatus Competibacter denitrificans]
MAILDLTDSSAEIAADAAAPLDLLTASGVRYEWYRDGFRLLLGLLILVSGILAVSVGLNVFLLFHQPSPKFLIQTADHQLVGIVPLNEPSFSDEYITQWVVEAILAANNWNFADYRESLQRACNQYFTPNGCQEYRDALIRIGNLESVKTKRLNVRAVVTKPPLILNKVVSGQTQRFTWNMQMEVMVSYLSSAEQTTQNLIVNVVVVRRPLTEYEKGIGIEKYVASVGGGH